MGREDFLISASDLQARLAGDHPPRLIDCRSDLFDPQAGERLWQAAHIPTALHADLNRDLSDMSQPAALGRHPLPQPARFARRLAAWGITDQVEVIAYDQGPGALAARLWWLLRSAGHRRVRVLDGGLNAWQRAGGALESGSTAAPASAQLTEWELPRQRWLDNRQLKRALDADSAVLIDAREAARYRGEVEPIDSAAGHIPGALSRPFSENLGSDGCFRSAEDLRMDFDRLRGSFAPKQVVHQCGSGVTACHNLLAMEIAGLHGSRLHAPSWSGWLAEGGEVAKS